MAGAGGARGRQGPGDGGDGQGGVRPTNNPPGGRALDRSGPRRVAGSSATLSPSITPGDPRAEIEDQDVLRRLVGGRGRALPSRRPLTCRVFGSRSTDARRRRTSRVRPRPGRGSVRSLGIGGGHGTITVEFFDVGSSRRVAWERRPQAAALLGAGACIGSVVRRAGGGASSSARFTDRQFRQVGPCPVSWWSSGSPVSAWLSWRRRPSCDGQ